MPARVAYCSLKASVVWCCRAACSASYCSRAWSPTMRGSFLARVHCARCGHDVQSFRAKRASHLMPLWGEVCGCQEMLCLPIGHVTTCWSQSTRNCDVSNPVPSRACQLGSAATGPTMCTPVLHTRHQGLCVRIPTVDQMIPWEQG